MQIVNYFITQFNTEKNPVSPAVRTIEFPHFDFPIDFDIYITKINIKKPSSNFPAFQKIYRHYPWKVTKVLTAWSMVKNLWFDEKNIPVLSWKGHDSFDMIKRGKSLVWWKKFTGIIPERSRKSDCLIIRWKIVDLMEPHTVVIIQN